MENFKFEGVNNLLTANFERESGNVRVAEA